MRMPWISRDVVDWLRDEVNQKTEELRIARAEYHDLLDKYHALKAGGAVIPMQAQSREIDPVTQAVIAKSRGNPVLYQHYGTFVATQRALGSPEEEIAGLILHGIPDDQGVPL